MNPNQDLIDIIRLNELEEMNEENLLPEEEKKSNAVLINRKRQEKMHKVALKLTPEQVAKSKEQERIIYGEVLKEE